jgi:hypothetical protein
MAINAPIFAPNPRLKLVPTQTPTRPATLVSVHPDDDEWDEWDEPSDFPDSPDFPEPAWDEWDPSEEGPPEPEQGDFWLEEPDSDEQSLASDRATRAATIHRPRHPIV